MKWNNNSALSILTTTSLMAVLLLLLSTKVTTVYSQQQDDTGKTQLGGILTTRYNVDSYARLSLDIRDIRNRIQTDDKNNNGGTSTPGNTNAMEIYVDGLNANDPQTGLRRSLRQLATDLAVKEPKTPAFLYQLYGLTGTLSTHLNVDIEGETKYIDSFVRNIFQQDAEFASDAVLAVDVWMVATDFIYNAVYNCHATTVADDPNAVQLAPGGFDEFIALWIGVDQSIGTADGHSLYSLAQFMADQFEDESVGVGGGGDTTSSSQWGEAIINTRIITLYQQAATALSVPGACTASATPDLAAHLYSLGHQMVQEMVKLLFQGLIFSLAQEQMGGIRVYAKALVPQLAQCRSSIYKRLHKELVQLFDDNPTSVGKLDMEKVEMILDDLTDAMPCFGFYCEELGQVAGIGGFDLACDRNRPFPAFAGYRASSDVSLVSRVDLDVHQLGILTSLQSDFFARYLYMYGANVHKAREGDQPLTFVSLRDIALSKERFNAEPLYDYYVEYFNEKDYADKQLMQILGDGDSVLAGTDSTVAASARNWQTVDQKTTAVQYIAAYQILFMEAHAKLRSAVDQCKDADPEVGIMARLDPIDEAAALIIGSMEGEVLGGSPDLQDGQLLYNIANQHAFQFSVINAEKYANVNSEIIDSLFAATAELDALDCENLERTTTHIGRMITVGMIQGALQAATRNQKLAEGSTTAVTITQGEILTQSVNPWINHNDPTTATMIRDNMVVTSGKKLVNAGKDQVAQAFGHGLTYAIGLPCEYLGSTAEVDPCVGIPRNAGKGGGQSAAAMPFINYLTTLAVAAIPALLLVVL